MIIVGWDIELLFNLKIKNMYLDLVIVIAVLAVLAIWWILGLFKRKKTSEKEDVGGLEPLTEEQIEHLNRQQASKRIVLTQEPQEEKVEAAADFLKSEEKTEPKPEPASTPKKKALAPQELSGVALWNWWVAGTGDYRLSQEAIASVAAILTSEQARELCEKYKSQHPQLFNGICVYADWYDRSEPAAKIIGLRMFVLMKRGGFIHRK